MSERAKMVSEVFRQMHEKQERHREALGLKPGEGGRLAPVVTGYAQAMDDLQEVLGTVSN